MSNRFRLARHGISRRLAPTFIVPSCCSIEAKLISLQNETRSKSAGCLHKLCELFSVDWPSRNRSQSQFQTPLQFADLAVFRREFVRLAANLPDEEQDQDGRQPIQWRTTGIHLLFLCWTVPNAHYPVLMILGLLFFLGFVSATRVNQHPVALRQPFTRGLLPCGPDHSWSASNDG
jgi:hypothetical protein